MSTSSAGTPAGREPVIVGGARTAIGRLLGSLAGFSGADLGGIAIKAALERSGLSGDQVDYVACGLPEDDTDPSWAERIERHRERRPASWTTLETLDLDVCDDASVNAAVSEIERRTGPVDALVNNAGIAIAAVMEEVPGRRPDAPSKPRAPGDAPLGAPGPQTPVTGAGAGGLVEEVRIGEVGEFRAAEDGEELVVEPRHDRRGRAGRHHGAPEDRPAGEGAEA